jgi:hypothetical protein
VLARLADAGPQVRGAGWEMVKANAALRQNAAMVISTTAASSTRTTGPRMS